MPRSFALCLLTTAMVTFVGCGPSYHPVVGVVNMDGKPVAGATVAFVSEDGKQTAGGVTDDSGNFTISNPGGTGALAGSYKVTVTKFPKVDVSAPSTEPGGKIDKDYLNAMKKEMTGTKPGAITPPPGMKMPGGGVAPPPGMMPGASGSSKGVKSELPEIYASLEKTPLKATVPASGPVQLDLKSKP